MFIKKSALSIVILLSCTQSENLFACDPSNDSLFFECLAGWAQPAAPSGFNIETIEEEEWEKNPIMVTLAIKPYRAGNQIPLSTFYALAKHCKKNPNSSERPIQLLERVNQEKYYALLKLLANQRRSSLNDLNREQATLFKINQ